MRGLDGVQNCRGSVIDGTDPRISGETTVGTRIAFMAHRSPGYLRGSNSSPESEDGFRYSGRTGA